MDTRLLLRCLRFRQPEDYAMVRGRARNLVMPGAIVLLLAAQGSVHGAAPSPAPSPARTALPMTSLAVTPGTPAFAAINGDGQKIGFAWWAVKGATLGYELLRASDPQAAPTSIATVAAGTLGATDAHPAATGAYYQLVALGAGGTRTSSTWVFVNTPTVTSVIASGADVVIAWSTVLPAPAGYEIWRTTDPARAATRIGNVASGITTFTDRQAATGHNYYQVVALGGGARAASALYPYSAMGVSG